VTTDFLTWLDSTKRGEISDGQIRNYRQKWSVLKPHFDGINIEDVDHEFLVRLRDARAKETTKDDTPITNATLRKDILFCAAVLRYAMQVPKILSNLPTLPSFRGTFTVAANPTPYLTLRQYNDLWMLAKTRMNEAGLNPRVARQREELLCYVMISVCAALRPGEAESIRWMDCEKVTLRSGGEKMDAIKFSVFGKHGKRKNVREPAYGLYHAVEAFDHLKKQRADAKPEDRLFTEKHHDGIRKLLDAANLRTVVINGRVETRDAKSFRHTGISLWMKLSANANIEDIAKWARTSPEMIRRWYDQNPHEEAVERIAAFRQRPKSKPSEADAMPTAADIDAMEAEMDAAAAEQ